MDGTLTPLTTMFELLLFDARMSGRLEEGQAFLRGLRALKSAGTPREVTNREYFRWWAGREVAAVKEIGRNWFSRALHEHGQRLVFGSVRDRLQEHREKSHAIVLVSGSFPPALDGLALHVGADSVLTCDVLVDQGRYTGEISTPMIGMGKASAVTAHASRYGLNLAASHSYGDDVSDIPFMELCGRRVIVNGSDPALTRRENSPGWSVMAAS